MARKRSNALKARSGQAVSSVRAAIHVKRPDNETLRQWRHRLKMLKQQAKHG